MQKSFDLNQRAVCILKEKIIPDADALGIGVVELTNGATVIDMGINYPGGWLAGKYFTEACLGGLGELTFGKLSLGKYYVPSVKIQVTQPAIAEMSSHVAHWKLFYKGRNVVISGPIRAIRGADFFASAVAYRDLKAKETVAMIQTTETPEEELAEYMAGEVGLAPKNLYILVAKTASIVGAIQVCARNVEQVLPTIYDHGFSMDKVVYANGITPLVSIVDDELVAYGRVNDCLIYGQESNIYVRCQDEDITKILDVVPMVKAKNTGIYGIPFQELFARSNNDWAQVPRDWDAPAKINFHNLLTGHSFTTGKIEDNVLIQSFLG